MSKFNTGTESNILPEGQKPQGHYYFQCPWNDNEEICSDVDITVELDISVVISITKVLCVVNV